MSHLQASTRSRRRHSLPDHTPLEDRRRRDSLGPRPIVRSLALLRSRPASRVDACSARRPPLAATTRTKALPNPLPAHLLEHARPLVFSFVHSLCHHRTPDLRVDCRVLAQPYAAIFALFGAAALDRPPRPTSHRLRSRHSRASIPSALRLGRHSIRQRHPAPQTPPLSRLRAAAARPARTLDTPSAFRPSDGRSFVWNMDNR